MDLIDAIRNRRTTNGPFKLDPVSKEHQHLLIEAAPQPFQLPALAFCLD